MKLRCPACGANIDLDQAAREADLEALVKAAAAFGADWQLISEYLDAFRARREGSLALKKRLRLAREVWEIYHSGRFSLERRQYQVGRPEFLTALAQVCNRELAGLKNHNYLKRVLVGAAEETSRRRERELRHKEEQLRAGVREAEAPAEEEEPPSPEWRKEFRRLLKESTRPGLTPKRRAEIQAQTREHLKKRKRRAKNNGEDPDVVATRTSV